jgi:hypothetical protein
MSDAQKNKGRRNFLLGASAASVAGAAALVVSTKPETNVKTSKAGIPEGKGYQLTEHVRNYYRTTTI